MFKGLKTFPKALRFIGPGLDQLLKHLITSTDLNFRLPVIHDLPTLKSSRELGVSGSEEILFRRDLARGHPP
jgi:hypothetical protein